MQGPISQAIALVCHGNDSLKRGVAHPFPRDGSPSLFCESIEFVDATQVHEDRRTETRVARDPHAWFAHLLRRGVRSLSLAHQPSGDDRASDFETVGFAGGGGSWWIVAEDAKGDAHGWLGRWLLGDQEAPDRRIWRVTYGDLGEIRPAPAPSLSAAAEALDGSLEAVLAFSREHAQAAFADAFERALSALRTGEPHGLCADLAPGGSLPAPCLRLLDACAAGWVFGGMGSWNDQVFEGRAARAFKSVSAETWSALVAATVAATNGSRPGWTP
jgi:hypothetical protein